MKNEFNSNKFKESQFLNKTCHLNSSKGFVIHFGVVHNVKSISKQVIELLFAH